VHRSNRFVKICRNRRWRVGFGGAVLVLLSLLGSLQTAARSTQIDETLWAGRSRQFATGLVTGQPRLMTAFPVNDADTGKSITMPGVTTMWVGTGVLLYECVVRDPAPDALQACVKDRERPDRRSVHIVMALLNALLLLGLWQLCRKPFGEMAAGIGAVLIAGEPFLAALNGMFHTDAFIAYLSMIAYVALCRSLSLFGKEEEPSRFAGLAGVAFGLAILTKLTAVGLVPAAAVCVGWALFKEWGNPTAPKRLVKRFVALLRGPTARRVFIGVAVAMVTFFALWPGMVADPARQVGALRSSAKLAELGHGQFFRGRYSSDPPWYFSFYVLGFRMTPWSFLGLCLIPLPLLLRRVDRRWLLIATFIASQSLLLGLSAKKIDRYSAVLLVGIAFLIGVSFDLVFGYWARSKFRRTSIVWIVPLALVLGTGLVYHTIQSGQRASIYYNEALGGLSEAEGQVLVTWSGEPFEAKEWLDKRYEGDSSRYVQCQPSFWGDELSCPETEPGQDRVYVETISDRQLGRRLIPAREKDLWSRVDSYNVDGVEILTYWVNEAS
jgi:hypothetical protein